LSIEIAVVNSHVGDGGAAYAGSWAAKTAMATIKMLRYFTIMHFTAQNYKKKLISAIKKCTRACHLVK
jgi:hypothetical protein